MTHTPPHSPLWHILRNDEGRYSVWPKDQPAPAGWTITGDPGTREDCLSRIAEIWTDMRPDALKKVMA